MHEKFDFVLGRLSLDWFSGSFTFSCEFQTVDSLTKTLHSHTVATREFKPSNNAAIMYRVVTDSPFPRACYVLLFVRQGSLSWLHETLTQAKAKQCERPRSSPASGLTRHWNYTTHLLQLAIQLHYQCQCHHVNADVDANAMPMPLLAEWLPISNTTQPFCHSKTGSGPGSMTDGDVRSSMALQGDKSPIFRGHGLCGVKADWLLALWVSFFAETRFWSKNETTYRYPGIELRKSMLPGTSVTHILKH